MIAVVSHDAGGAEMLSSWLRRCLEPYCLVLEGPAKSIFQRKIGNHSVATLSDAIQQSDWVLCGTSWQSNLERQAITQAKAAGKKVVAFLDHWVCYEERFIELGVSVYPDEIWVGDLDAKKIAQLHFPSLPVVFKSNPFFEDLIVELAQIEPVSSTSQKKSMLYVCEPLGEQALIQYGNEYYWGYTEEEALQFFLKNIKAIGVDIKEVNIRPHPSENRAKYNWAIKPTAYPIRISGDKTLLEEISEADVVIGCESMAMVVGLLAKRRVISSIPPGGKACGLPQRGIERLQVLVANHASLLRG